MPPKPKGPKVLLFDLGGVIVRWVGIDALATLSGLSPNSVTNRLGQSKIAYQYERGFGSDTMFLRELIRIFDLDVSENQMKKFWNSWVQDPYEGIADRLLSLKNSFTTACLSNTNAMHWTHLNTYLPCHELFDHVYASQQINKAKPDEECFHHVIDDLQINPTDIWFFDDSASNVLAAQKLGMTALKIDPKAGVIPTLDKFGFK